MFQTFLLVLCDEIKKGDFKHLSEALSYHNRTISNLHAFSFAGVG